MKEIKAYVRPMLLETIVGQLEKAGARDITVIRVDALGALVDYEMDRWHFLRKYNEKYSACAKLEVVCSDEEAARFVAVIKEHGYFGEPGDGRVFVSNVESAVNIRTGAEGESAL